jgi:hypothetical protein
MRIGDVGAVSPAGDLLAFSLAVVIIGMLLMKIGAVEVYQDDSQNGPTVPEVKVLLQWNGFDPDGDGVLDPFTNLDGPELPHVPVDGSLVVRMVFGEEEVEHLFVDGEYGGRVFNSTPISMVVGTTSLFRSRGLVHCGTFECYFVEAVI